MPREVDATPCASCGHEPSSEWLGNAGVPATVMGAPSALLDEQGVRAIASAYQGAIAQRDPIVEDDSDDDETGGLPNDTIEDAGPDLDFDRAPDTGRPSSLEPSTTGGFGRQPLVSVDLPHTIPPERGGTNHGAPASSARQSETRMIDAPAQLGERPVLPATASGLVPTTGLLSQNKSVTLDTSAREVVRYARTMDPDDPASVDKVQELLEQLVQLHDTSDAANPTENALNQVEAVLAESKRKRPTAPALSSQDSIPDFAANLIDWAREVSTSHSISDMVELRMSDRRAPPEPTHSIMPEHGPAFEALARLAGGPKPERKDPDSISSITASMEEKSSSIELPIHADIDRPPTPSDEKSPAWDAFDGLGLGPAATAAPTPEPRALTAVPTALDGGRVTVADGRVRVAASQQRLSARRRNVHGAKLPEDATAESIIGTAKPDRPDRFRKQAADAPRAASVAPARAPVDEPALTPPPVADHALAAESPFNVRVLAAIAIGIAIGALVMWFIAR